jgi:hypothetical protein
MSNTEIGDCVQKPDDQHTAVNIEGACICGETIYGHQAEVCGECIYWRRRKHLAQEPRP